MHTPLSTFMSRVQSKSETILFARVKINCLSFIISWNILLSQHPCKPEHIVSHLWKPNFCQLYLPFTQTAPMFTFSFRVKNKPRSTIFAFMETIPLSPFWSFKKTIPISRFLTARQNDMSSFSFHVNTTYVYVFASSVNQRYIIPYVNKIYVYQFEFQENQTYTSRLCFYFCSKLNLFLPVCRIKFGMKLDNTVLTANKNTKAKIVCHLVKIKCTKTAIVSRCMFLICFA